MPSLRATNQSGLGFAAKKSIHPSPAKKKTQAIDLTASSPPISAKSFAPLFEQRKRTSATNPFEDEEEEKEKEEKKSNPENIEKDEFGFIKTVPAGFTPLGKGKPTAEMIGNLVGSDEKEVDGEDSDENAVEFEEEEEIDPAFFRTEKSRSKVVDVDSDDIALKRTVPHGVKVRKAMDKALSEVESAQKGSAPKLNSKDKKWTGIYKETQAKMGSADEPIHCTPQTHNRIHHILRVFDLSSEWGPCTGISRLERWNRAEASGLEPPTEVRDILLTQEGAKDASYRETIFHDRGIYVP